MRINKIGVFVIFTWFLNLTYFSQNGELGQFDCTYAKEIVVPFNYNQNEKPLLDQKVFYSFRDQFTFWYKVVIKKSETVRFKVIPLNDSDAYSVLVYNYNQADFCKQVFMQKIKPARAGFFIGKGSQTIKDENEKAFYAQENNVYYIGVLNTSLNNCGHRFLLSYGKDTLKVDAVHLPCKRDVTTLSVKHATVSTKTPEPKIIAEVSTKKDTLVAQKTEPKKDTIIDNKIEANKETEQKTWLLEITTLNSGNKKPVDSKLVVYDKETGVPLITEVKGKGICRVSLEKNKTYVVKGTAFGYKNREIILGSQEFFGKKNKTDILFDPLKAGDSFIMKSIYFVPNTYALKKESLEELEKLLVFLKNNENIFIEIQGHTNGDNRIYKNPSYESLGEEWNFSGTSKKLSQKRAETIRDYLTNKGIVTERLIAKGYGGQKMIIRDPETNEEGQQNIRVEIYVLKN